MVQKKTSESKPVTACRKEKQTRNQNYTRYIYTHFYKTGHWQQANLPINSSLLNKVYLMQTVTCILRRSAQFIILPHKQKHFYCTVLWKYHECADLEYVWICRSQGDICRNQVKSLHQCLSYSAKHSESTVNPHPKAKSPEYLEVRCVDKTS